MIKRLILVAALAAVIPAAVSGADKPKDTHFLAAMRLLKITNTEKTLDTSMNQMLKIQMQAKPALRPYENVMKKFLRKYISWDTLKNDLAKLYMAEFTEKELNEIIAFYKTPTGKKAIEKIPVIMQKSAQLSVQRIQEHKSELQEMIRAEQARNAPF
jgi:hypothetical protein